MVITDWPEGQAMSLTKAGATSSKRNCRVCEHPTKDFGITADGYLGPKRIMGDTIKCVQRFTAPGVSMKVINDAEKDRCVYMMSNGLWEERGGAVQR